MSWFYEYIMILDWCLIIHGVIEIVIFKNHDGMFRLLLLLNHLIVRCVWNDHLQDADLKMDRILTGTTFQLGVEIASLWVR